MDGERDRGEMERMNRAAAVRVHSAQRVHGAEAWVSTGSTELLQRRWREVLTLTAARIGGEV